MTDKYNGWTNRETWQVVLWWGDFFEEEGGMDEDTMRDYVSNDLFERVEGPTDGTLIGDVLNDFISAVNWKELVETYSSEDADEDEDDEDESEDDE